MINSRDAFEAADQAMKQQLGTGLKAATIGREFALDLYQLVSPSLAKRLTESEFLHEVELGAIEYRGVTLKAAWV